MRLFSKKNKVIGIISATDNDSAKALRIKSIINKKAENLKLGSKNLNVF